MADCHALFQEFHDKIKLTTSKESYLKNARDAIREKIRKYFRETLKVTVPKFHGQGSYSMSTIINPIGEEEYDIDDGVYLQNLDSDMTKWQNPETVHQWIYNAVDGHTDTKPMDKRTCIRVIYSKQYHVDLPIYGIHDDIPYIAEKGDAGWHVSDPRAITNWFKSSIKKSGEQLRRIVRYLKAWADNKSSFNLPCGLILTVLAVNNYEQSDRDDGAFAGSINNILNQISYSQIILNPIDSTEYLNKRISDAQWKNFKERLEILRMSASESLKADSLEEAYKKWQSEFGERFILPDKSKTNIEYPLKTAAPAILRDDARSA